MVLAAFVEKGPLLPKEEAHWRVLSIVGFVVVCEAFIGIEPYGPLLTNLLQTSLIGGEAA